MISHEFINLHTLERLKIIVLFAKTILSRFFLETLFNYASDGA